MYPLAGSSSLKNIRLSFHRDTFLSVNDTPHAQGGAENEGYGEGASDHGQEMLEAQEQAHVPGGNIVNFVGNVQTSFLFFLLAWEFNILRWPSSILSIEKLFKIPVLDMKTWHLKHNVVKICHQRNYMYRVSTGDTLPVYLHENNKLIPWNCMQIHITDTLYYWLCSSDFNTCMYTELQYTATHTYDNNITCETTKFSPFLCDSSCLMSHMKRRAAADDFNLSSLTLGILNDI